MRPGDSRCTLRLCATLGILCLLVGCSPKAVQSPVPVPEREQVAASAEASGAKTVSGELAGVGSGVDAVDGSVTARSHTLAVDWASAGRQVSSEFLVTDATSLWVAGTESTASTAAEIVAAIDRWQSDPWRYLKAVVSYEASAGAPPNDGLEPPRPYDVAVRIDLRP